jgi:hypothetical protein
VAANAESQRQIDGVAYADADRDEDFTRLKPIVEHLEGRAGIEEVKAVMLLPREIERLAQPAWT